MRENWENKSHVVGKGGECWYAGREGRRGVSCKNGEMRCYKAHTGHMVNGHGGGRGAENSRAGRQPKARR